MSIVGILALVALLAVVGVIALTIAAGTNEKRPNLGSTIGERALGAMFSGVGFFVYTQYYVSSTKRLDGAIGVAAVGVAFIICLFALIAALIGWIVVVLGYKLGDRLGRHRRIWIRVGSGVIGMLFGYLLSPMI